MQPEDMILVSVDDHLVQPTNLVDGRAIRQPGGSEVWAFNGAIVHV